MHICKYLTCFCCAGLMILTGCTADNGQAEASNTAANTANTNIAAVQPASSNTFGNTSTPVSSAMEIHNSIQTPCMKLNMPVTI